MKKLLVLFLVAMPAFLHAQIAMRFGYVDFAKAFQEVQEAQKYNKEIEQDQRTLYDDEQKVDITMEEKGRKFQESMQKLSEAERQKQLKSLSEDYKKQKEALMNRKVELDQKRQKILGELEEKIRHIVNSIAREKKFDLVFNNATLPYISDEMKKTNDITGLLVERYNKAYPVKVEPAKPNAAPKLAPAAKKPAEGPKPAPKK